MSSNTPNLDLLKKDPVTDGDDTFNIDTMLNDNWDKIDAAAGSQTITDAQAPTGDTGTPTTLLGWLANVIKSITGKSSWRTAPATTLEAAKTHADDTTRHITAAERTTWNEVVQGKLAYAATAGNYAALAATITPAPAALSDGLRVSLKVHVAVSGPVTLNLNGLGDKSIKKPNGNDPTMALGGVYTVVYDGTAFILQGEGGDIPKLPNMVKHGNFENTGAAIEANSTYSTAYKKFGSYSLAITCPEGYPEYTVAIPSDITTTANHQYYVSVWAYTTTAAASAQIYARQAEPSVTQLLSANMWNFVSGILTYTTTSTDSARLDNNTANSTLYYDGLMIIDLTDAFGAGSEPSKATMDEMVQAYGGWWDSDLTALTKDATATAAQILSGYTAYTAGNKITGSMPNRANDQAAVASWTDGSGTLAVGFPVGAYVTNSGFGADTASVAISDPDFIAANILNGVNIFGLDGNATSDATAAAADIAVGKTAYVNGVKLAGSRSISTGNISLGNVSGSGGGSIIMFSLSFTIPSGKGLANMTIYASSSTSAYISYSALPGVRVNPCVSYAQGQTNSAIIGDSASANQIACSLVSVSFNSTTGLFTGTLRCAVSGGGTISLVGGYLPLTAYYSLA